MRVERAWHGAEGGGEGRREPRRVEPAFAFRFQRFGFRLRVSGFGFGFWVSGLDFWVLGFRVSDLGFRDFGFGLGLRFRVDG